MDRYPEQDHWNLSGLIEKVYSDRVKVHTSVIITDKVVATDNFVAWSESASKSRMGIINASVPTSVR